MHIFTQQVRLTGPYRSGKSRGQVCLVASSTFFTSMRCIILIQRYRFRQLQQNQENIQWHADFDLLPQVLRRLQSS